MWWIPIIRTIILYALIVAAVRLMGKRQISQLQTSELVATLMLSELAILPIQNYNEPLLTGIAPIATLVGCEMLVAILMLKSFKFRQKICGKPIVVIEKGVVNQKNMRRLRMTIEDLTEQLRLKDVFFLNEVDYAIVETNGSLSIMRCAADNPLTPKDAKVKVKNKGIEVVVVADGDLSESSLQLIGRTPQWLNQQIAAVNISQKDIFIMTADTHGNTTVIPRRLP